MGQQPEVDARGFTLLELIVTLVVVAVAVGLVAPTIGRSTEALRARAEVAGFSATFRHAREQAITTRQAFTVLVNPRSHLLTVTTGEDEVRWTRALSKRVEIRADTPSCAGGSLRAAGERPAEETSSRLGQDRLSRHGRRRDRTRAEPARMRRRSQAGFTLLEVLIAFAILSVAVVAVIQGFAQGLRLLKVAGDHQQAVLLADQKTREMVVPVGRGATRARKATSTGSASSPSCPRPISPGRRRPPNGTSTGST